MAFNKPSGWSRISSRAACKAPAFSARERTRCVSVVEAVTLVQPLQIQSLPCATALLFPAGSQAGGVGGQGCSAVRLRCGRDCSRLVQGTKLQHSAAYRDIIDANRYIAICALHCPIQRVEDLADAASGGLAPTARSVGRSSQEHRPRSVAAERPTARSVCRTNSAGPPLHPAAGRCRLGAGKRVRLLRRRH